MTSTWLPPSDRQSNSTPRTRHDCLAAVRPPSNSRTALSTSAVPSAPRPSPTTTSNNAWPRSNRRRMPSPPTSLTSRHASASSTSAPSTSSHSSSAWRSSTICPSPTTSSTPPTGWTGTVPCHKESTGKYNASSEPYSGCQPTRSPHTPSRFAGSAFRTAASAWSTPAPEPSLTSPYPCPRPPTPHDLASEWARATGPSSYHRQSPPYSTPHATPTLSSSDALTDSAHTSPTMPARTLLPSPQETNISASTRPQRAPSTDSSTTAAPFEYASSTRPPRPTSSTTCPAFCNRRPPTQ
mmetsp:Transcript_24006/g.54947  ORF Transcript_24006/g.54947 Transcript_24006/m.54947 type:complete len:296 (-) Transcript_24006:228-1115(-)